MFIIIIIIIIIVRGEIFRNLGRSFVYQNQIKLN